MADPQPGPVSAARPQRPGRGGSPILRRLQDHVPNSTQVVGFLTLLISGGILLPLTGLTLTATVMGLIIFAPLILLSSPIWVPAAIVLFFITAGFLSMCGFGVAALAGATWIYRYSSGRHPADSVRVDTASDYAREYGGYLQSRVKDAAPGA